MSKWIIYKGDIYEEGIPGRAEKFAIVNRLNFLERNTLIGNQKVAQLEGILAGIYGEGADMVGYGIVRSHK